MKLSGRARVLTVGVCAALLLSMAGAAQAAAIGWRPFFRQHYGTPANISGYRAVVALARRDAWALGGTDLPGRGNPLPVAEHWDGKTWRASPLPPGLSDSIDAASAASATDIWAVTQFGGYVLHWNGARWSLAKQLPGSGQLTGVTAFSARDVWVFGGGGSLSSGLGTWHFNGRVWRQWKGNASGLETASALSPVNIWAIAGFGGPHSALMHFNGYSWQPLTVRALSGLIFDDIHAFARNNIWASAYAGAGPNRLNWLVHFDGTQWTRLRVPSKIFGGAIAGDGRGGLWLAAVMYSNNGPPVPVVLHRTVSGRWSLQRFSRTTAVVERLALIPGTASLWAVGFAYTRYGADAVIWAYGKIG